MINMSDLLNEHDFEIPVEQSFKKACRWYYVNAALSVVVYGVFAFIELPGFEAIALLSVIIVAIGLAFRMVFLEPERSALKTGTYIRSFGYLALTYLVCAQLINLMLCVAGIRGPVKFGEYIVYGAVFPIMLFIFYCLVLLPIAAYRRKRFLKMRNGNVKS